MLLMALTVGTLLLLIVLVGMIIFTLTKLNLGNYIYNALNKENLEFIDTESKKKENIYEMIDILVGCY